MKTDAPRDTDSEFIDSKKTARPPEIGTKRVVLQTVPAGEEEQKFYSAERNRLGNFQGKKLAYQDDIDRKPGQRLSRSTEPTCRSACAPRPSP